MLCDVFTNLLLWARHFTTRELYQLPIQHSGFLQQALSVGEAQKTIPGGVRAPPAMQTLGKPPTNNGYVLEKEYLSLEMGSVNFLQGELLGNF